MRGNNSFRIGEKFHSRVVNALLLAVRKFGDARFVRKLFMDPEPCFLGSGAAYDRFLGDKIER